MPPINPIIIASHGCTTAHPAVIETNPPNTELVNEPISNFRLYCLVNPYKYIILHMPLPIDAFTVVTAALEASFHFPVHNREKSKNNR